MKVSIRTSRILNDDMKYAYLESMHMSRTIEVRLLFYPKLSNLKSRGVGMMFFMGGFYNVKIV